MHVMRSQWQILIRQKRAKGLLSTEETRALSDARNDECIRRLWALSAYGRLSRALRSFGRALLVGQ